MKYQTASYIRSCVDAISVEGGFLSVCAACRRRSDNVDEWEVALFSRLDVAADFFNYVLLAKAICGLAPSLTFYQGQYNSAVYGEDIHQAIIIW